MTDDLNRRIAGAMGWRELRLGPVIQWISSDGTIRGRLPDYLHDKAATLDALERLAEAEVDIRICLDDESVSIEKGVQMFLIANDVSSSLINISCGEWQSMSTGDTLSEAIWRAWLAMKEAK